jgi:hypothetical protein
MEALIEGKELVFDEPEGAVEFYRDMTSGPFSGMLRGWGVAVNITPEGSTVRLEKPGEARSGGRRRGSKTRLSLRD